MRLFVCSLLILFTSSSCGRSQPVMKTSGDSLQLQIAETSSVGAIVVHLKNGSPKAVRIWKDSNTWGAARWRVFLTRNGQLQTFFQNPDHDFTRNVPSFNEIAPSAFLEQKLDLNDGDWRGTDGRMIRFEPNDSIIVVYDVPFTVEALNLKVWYGVVAVFTTYKGQS